MTAWSLGKILIAKLVGLHTHYQVNSPDLPSTVLANRLTVPQSNTYTRVIVLYSI